VIFGGGGFQDGGRGSGSSVKRRDGGHAKASHGHRENQSCKGRRGSRRVSLSSATVLKSLTKSEVTARYSRVNGCGKTFEWRKCPVRMVSGQDGEGAGAGG